jgi:uncharacterized protein (TIGR03435 family)
MTLAINRLMLLISSSFAASIVTKVTVALGLGLVAVWLARGSRAAVRHALLAAIFGVALLLPIASGVMPPLRVDVPAVVESRTTLPPIVAARDAALSVIRPEASPRTSLVVSRARRPSYSNLLFAGWAAGTTLFLLPVVIGLWQIRSLRRSGLPWRRGQSAVETLVVDAGIHHRRVEVLLHESLPGPMTCGILHPVIVLPRDAENWNQADLNRAIVHELEHVRRGDSVSRCLARVAGAVYWFHPMVWIAWRRLVLEAERSCDDAVLRHSEGTAYAEQLIGLAKRLSVAQRAPVLAMASRADLATRVRAVLDSRQRRGRAGTFLLALAFAGAVVLVVILSSITLVAASQEPQPAFEVASIKSNKTGVRDRLTKLGGATVTFRNQTLKNIVLNAYEIREFQLLKGPNWIDSDRFDIDAKVAGDPSIDKRRLMLQTLLRDRFKLALHREVKDLPIFQMTVAKGGLKLQPLKEGSCLAFDPNNPTPAPGKTRMDYCDYGGIGRGMFEASNTTMPGLATFLSMLLDRTVVDKTAITGTFRVHLTFVPDQDTPSQFPGPPSAPGNVADGPNIFNAIQEQLGLTLVPAKGPVEVLVIDHVEKPSEN